MKRISRKDIAEMEKRYRAALVNSLSGFKSANLIGSRSKDGIANLSIVSSTIHLGSNPPLLGTVFRPDSVPRHTLDNLRESGYYTVNHVNSSFTSNAHQTAARYHESISEFEACNLSEEYLGDFKQPFVKQAVIKMAMKKVDEIKIEINGTILVIGEIQDLYLSEDFLRTDGSVDLEKANTVAISGLDTYLKASKIARYSYAKPHKELERLDNV
ncbi:MAG: flavin reductase [Bacteroidota bacterium]